MTTITECDFMAIHANILFTYDSRGRMLRSNEPREDARRPAPRLFVGTTTSGQVIRFGERMPDGAAQRLSEIIESEPVGSDLRLSPSAQTEIGAVLGKAAPWLEQHGTKPEEGGGPAYRFPESVAPQGGAIQLTTANREVVRDTYPWLYLEIDDWQPCFAVVIDGAAVSVCFSSRVGDAAAEAGIETLPAFRGHGFAAAVTAAWAATIRDTGRIPLYSTTWDNRASQAVARRLGLIMYGADATWP